MTVSGVVFLIFDFLFSTLISRLADAQRASAFELSGELETFVIWFMDFNAGGPVGFWTLQLMTALARQLPVEISHQQDSAHVLQVRVGAGTP